MSALIASSIEPATEPDARRLRGRQAEFEPPFLAPRLRLHKWGAVINAVDTLVTRIASLESALEGAYGEGVIATAAALKYAGT